MQIRWPTVFLVLGSGFLLWLLTTDNGRVSRRVARLFDVVIDAADRDPLYALALVAMGIITLFGIARLVMGFSHHPRRSQRHSSWRN